MRRLFLLLSILLVGCLFNSCDSDDLEYQNKFETSLKIWLNFKEYSNNSYKYTSTEGLPIDIKQGELQWTETNSEIGIHKNGAEPITLSEIYNKAQNDWLIERNNVTTYLETKNNGMISTCGYVENNCADDCFIGIHINNISLL